MRETLVAGGCLQCVRERVAEVEDRATALVERIAEAHRSLERCAGPDHRLVLQLPERAARQQSCLDDLGHAFTPLRVAQRREDVGVGDDPGRVVKSADEVLAGRRSIAVLPPIAAST